jgi:hypothetical protein
MARHAAVSRETVAFYAPSPERTVRLREALEGFARHLPGGVTYVPIP